MGIAVLVIERNSFMPKKINKDDNQSLNKLFASLAHRGIKLTDKLGLTIDEMIAEGDKLLSENNSGSNTEPIPKTKDYYRQARLQLFQNMDAKKISMLQKMEKEKDTNNGIYQNFVDEVIKLGDKISNN